MDRFHAGYPRVDDESVRFISYASTRDRRAGISVGIARRAPPHARYARACSNSDTDRDYNAGNERRRNIIRRAIRSPRPHGAAARDREKYSRSGVQNLPGTYRGWLLNSDR